MFSLSKDELTKRGAEITVREIKQQPELWDEVWDLYQTVKEEVDSFLKTVKESAQEKKVRVIFTGAGTSQYVGDMVVPYLNKVGDKDTYLFQSIGTTDIVSSPEEYLAADEPTLLVSFARSGNSPESIATVELADKVIKNIHHLTITCAPQGALAKRSETEENNFLFLEPARSNDDGFAMTGSFTCMALTALLIFDQTEVAQKKRYVHTMINMGNDVITREQEVQKIVDLNFDRIVYLGSGSLSGLTREAQLKLLELTAGQVATVFDSSMGFRHGPKSFVNANTLVFDFVNNEPYTRDYDIDILEEVKADEIASGVIAIGQKGQRNFSGQNFTFSEEKDLLPDGYLALADVVFAQTLAVMTSLKVNNTPDTPSKTGTVNRVVKGVTIHEYNK